MRMYDLLSEYITEYINVSSCLFNSMMVKVYYYRLYDDLVFTKKSHRGPLTILVSFVLDSI